MPGTIKALLGLCLLAVAVFGSVKVIEHIEEDGRSPYEKQEAELDEERAEDKDTLPLTTPASREHFVARHCLHMARSKKQLQRCVRRPARGPDQADRDAGRQIGPDD